MIAGQTSNIPSQLPLPYLVGSVSVSQGSAGAAVALRGAAGPAVFAAGALTVYGSAVGA